MLKKNNHVQVRLAGWFTDLRCLIVCLLGLVQASKLSAKQINRLPIAENCIKVIATLYLIYLANISSIQRLTQHLCQSGVSGLTDFHQIAQTWYRAPLNGVFSTLFAVIVVEKRHMLHQITHSEEVIVPQTLDDMPPLPSILLSIIHKSPSVTKDMLLFKL